MSSGAMLLLLVSCPIQQATGGPLSCWAVLEDAHEAVLLPPEDTRPLLNRQGLALSPFWYCFLLLKKHCPSLPTHHPHLPRSGFPLEAVCS